MMARDTSPISETPMARENLAPAEPKALVTADSFANFNARLGANASNLQGGATYINQRNRTRNWLELNAMYRSSGLMRKAIDTVPDHMTREGIDLTTKDDPEQFDPLMQAFDDLGIWDEIGDGLRWGRLFGGALNVMLIDGQSLETPLNPDTIGKDQFKGFATFDRWQLQPVQQIITEYGPDFGLPVAYDILADGNPLGGKRVHYSRVIRYGGARLPYRERLYEQGWDASYVEVWYDRLVNLDTATAGTAQLIHKAHLRTVSIQNLRTILAAGGPAFDALMKQVENMRVTQTLEGVTMLDANDKFEGLSYSFSGLDNVLASFKQDFSAVVEIPMAILYGQSPSGLNADGDMDMDVFVGHLKQNQERRLRRGLARTLDVMHRSVMGRAPEDGFGFNFRDISPMSEETKSKIFQQDATALNTLEGSGIISRATTLSELKSLSEITGRGTKITDEDITEAESDPPEIQPGYVAPPPKPGEVDPTNPKAPTQADA